MKRLPLMATATHTSVRGSDPLSITTSAPAAWPTHHANVEKSHATRSKRRAG